MKKKKMTQMSLLNAILVFLSIDVVVTIAVMVYALIPEGKSEGYVAAVMMSVIIVLALVSTALDFVRRKLTVAKPVNKILSATDKIASGDFSVQLRITHSYRRYDEYDYIMENLNRMAAELAKMEVLHSDFIANVSHELKTPLAIIQNYATLLQNEKLDAETRKNYAQTLVSASRRLTALVSNILKLNKLENQELKPEIGKFRLDEQIAESVLQFEDLIDEKNLQLECDLDETEIVSSRDYLEIVWSNLLSNAIKFTENGGKIGVSLKQSDAKAIIRVSDTGCGISKEVGGHIFEKFYQGDTSHSKEGNGLGLALVKKVIEILGGDISVESQSGRGSTFTVVLKKRLP